MRYRGEYVCMRETAGYAALHHDVGRPLAHTCAHSMQGESEDTMASNTVNRKPQLSFWQIWNMCFGFLGIQFGFALQNANVSRIFQTLGAEMDSLPGLWIAYAADEWVRGLTMAARWTWRGWLPHARATHRRVLRRRRAMADPFRPTEASRL